MKIKKIMYGFLATFLLSPMIAYGQWGVGLRNASSGGTPGGTIYDIISGIMLWILAILGFIGIIGFVISGILYLTAAGDETKMGTAKNAMTYSIIGVIVGLLGYVMIQAIDTMLDGVSVTF